MTDLLCPPSVPTTNTITQQTQISHSEAKRLKLERAAQEAIQVFEQSVAKTPAVVEAASPVYNVCLRLPGNCRQRINLISEMRKRLGLPCGNLEIMTDALVAFMRNELMHLTRELKKQASAADQGV